MGDVLYTDSSNVLRRGDLYLGDGASGRRCIPASYDDSGNEIALPKLSNMVLNLCKYSFSLNDKHSASQFMQNSDLDIGYLTFTDPPGQSNAQTIAKIKSISNEFGDKIFPATGNVDTAINQNYAIDINRGLIYSRRDGQSGIGIRIQQQDALIQNTGDSFAISMNFGFNNPVIWSDILQIISDGSSRNTDNHLRLEVATNNHLYFYSLASSTNTAEVEVSQGRGMHDKLLNLIINVRRVANPNSGDPDNLFMDVWMNNVKVADNSPIGIMKGAGKNLFCFNSAQTGRDKTMHLWLFGFRVWNTELTEDEVAMVHKIELRDLGVDSIPPEGLNIYPYLTR